MTGQTAGWQPIDYAPWGVEVLVYDLSPYEGEPPVFPASYDDDPEWPHWQAAEEMGQYLDPSDIMPTHYFPGWHRGDPLPDPPMSEIEKESILTDNQTAGSRSAERIAQEMAERMRKDFGYDMRHPAGLRWLTSCIREIQADGKNDEQ
jgi:hypothetical protein